MFKLVLATFVNLFLLYNAYVVPEVTITVFSKGFEVSIPADDKDTYVALHAKLNESFDGREAGTLAKDALNKTNRRFFFRDRNTQLNYGDKIYYWIYVIHDVLIYYSNLTVYEVKRFTSRELTTSNPPSLTRNISNKQLNIPIGNRCSTTSVTFVNGENAACPGDVIFEEDFSGRSLDLNKWRMERRIPVGPDYEFNTYLNNTQTLSITNGRAVLKPVTYNSLYGKDSIYDELKLRYACTGEFKSLECDRDSYTITNNILPPFITPQFSTINSFKFRYGKVEIRAKLPSAKWVFPQIQLNPVDHRYGKGQYDSGQLRVVQSNGECEIVSGAVLSDAEPFRSAKMCSHQCSYNGDWNNQFHVYAMVWLPDSIKFSVDGKEICSVNPGQGLHTVLADGQKLPSKDALINFGETPLAPFDKNFYLTIGYGIGGINDFPDEPGKPWTNEDPRAVNKFWKKSKSYNYEDSKFKFTIDYVKVYAV